jgi:hypothetical protein
MVPTHASKPLVWLLTIAVACFISMACATEKGSEQEDSEAAEEPQEQTEAAGNEANESDGREEVKVYTNEDLQRLFGDEELEESELPPEEEPAEQQPAPAVAVEQESPDTGPSDPLSLLQQQQAQDQERSRSRAEAEQAVATAQSRVTELEQRILALRNPFMARPEIPEDEKSEWDSMGTADRLKKTEEQLSRAREELAEAQKELQKYR